ncbi:Hypothetical predicted protein [Paramuricea clavata]|uniref:DUF6589 domain-containing protein n=1 Tax=Paramuricea clavata TaxID=317549 RepID=A0A7D9EPG6_PARCT|nr:Hypothetical predicted protein [Paramuricea clavata]
MLNTMKIVSNSFLVWGKCFTIEALIQFFGMENQDDHPTKHKPPSNINEMGREEIEKYYEDVLDEFINQFLLANMTGGDSDENDFVNNYSICLLQYFFVLHDMKDAVHEGNGERLATLHKQLLLHFKSVQGFNSYAIEMLINVVQNMVFLSPAQSHQCIWASTANWKGGAQRNVEIDLLQENRNRDLKKLIKGMGANKTDKAIDNASRAVGGARKIAENFDYMVYREAKSSSHSHASSLKDESKVLSDLRILKPFSIQANRKHASFRKIK